MYIFCRRFRNAKIVMGKSNSVYSCCRNMFHSDMTERVCAMPPVTIRGASLGETALRVVQNQTLGAFSAHTSSHTPPCVPNCLPLIRYVLLEDPENWVSINRKTGAITSVKQMDRESPVLNGTGVYNILIGAIDNGSRDSSSKKKKKKINFNAPPGVFSGFCFRLRWASRDCNLHPANLPAGHQRQQTSTGEQRRDYLRQHGQQGDGGGPGRGRRSLLRALPLHPEKWWEDPEAVDAPTKLWWEDQ